MSYELYLPDMATKRATPRASPQGGHNRAPDSRTTPNLPTNIVHFRVFDSSIILVWRGGIPRPIGDFPESLTQAMLVGCNVRRETGRTTTLLKTWPYYKLKIHPRGVQWKQGVVICMLLYASWLFDTTLIHYTPLPRTPLWWIPTGSDWGRATRWETVLLSSRIIARSTFQRVRGNIKVNCVNPETDQNSTFRR